MADRPTAEQLLAVKLPWFEIRNQSEDDGTGGAPDGPATVLIFDEIGGSFGVSAKKFAAELGAIDAREIHVRINSPGGSVFDAIAIHSALLHHPARVRTYVDGLAASAASVVAMAADPFDEVSDTGGIVMMPGSQMMIHDASMLEDGDAAAHAKVVTFLHRQSDNVAGMYRSHGGGEIAEWRALMLEETWMFDQEAVDMGLADRVERHAAAPDPEPDPLMTRSFDLGRFRYAGRRAAPAPTRGRRTTTRVRDREDAMAEDRTTASFGQGSAEAAAARAEAAEREAHARAQEGRSVPVLASNPLYQTQLRAVRTGLPRISPADTPGGDAARVQSFKGRLQRAGTERRNGKELAHLAGYATVFSKRYEMWDAFGPYWEEVAPGAADDTLAADPDVAFLVNHMGMTMARTRVGGGRSEPTLILAADAKGLADDAFVNPERGDIQELLTAIDDELIDEQSFAFMVTEGGWDDAWERYTIYAFDIHRGDVSAVNYGANPYTSISARSQQVMRDLSALPPSMARAALDTLSRRTDVAAQRVAAHLETPVAPAPAPVVPAAPMSQGRRITQIEAELGV